MKTNGSLAYNDGRLTLPAKGGIERWSRLRLSVCSTQRHPSASYEGQNLFLFNFLRVDFQYFNLLITLFGGYVIYTYLCRIND